MSLAAVCSILFAIGAGLFIWKLFRPFAPWSFLLAGIGPAGAVSAFATGLAGFFVKTGGSVTQALFGVRLALGIVLFIGIYVTSRLLKGKGGLIACAICFAFPTMLTLIGAAGLVDAVGSVLKGIGSGAANIVQSF